MRRPRRESAYRLSALSPYTTLFRSDDIGVAPALADFDPDTFEIAPQHDVDPRSVEDEVLDLQQTHTLPTRTWLIRSADLDGNPHTAYPDGQGDFGYLITTTSVSPQRLRTSTPTLSK